MRLVASWWILSFALAAPASAQSGWSVTPYAGYLVVDDDFDATPGLVRIFPPPGTTDPGPELGPRPRREVGDAFLAGARVGADLSERWAFEASYGWAEFDVDSELLITHSEDPPVTRVESTEIMTASLHLWEALARYRFGHGPVRPILAAGAGIAARRVRIGRQFEEIGLRDESHTTWAAVAGAGLEYVTNPRVSLRADLRDHVHDCGPSCRDAGLLHDIEISAGADIRF